MIPESERVPYANYRPGFGCITFSEYDKMRAQALRLIQGCGCLPAIYELTRRDEDYIAAHKREMNEWLVENEYSVDIVSAYPRGHGHGYGRRPDPVDRAIDGRVVPLLHGDQTSYQFLCMESSHALFAFKLRWL